MGPDAMIFVFECWALSQLFHSALSPSSRGFLVPLHLRQSLRARVVGLGEFKWSEGEDLRFGTCLCKREGQELSLLSWNMTPETTKSLIVSFLSEVYESRVVLVFCLFGFFFLGILISLGTGFKRIIKTSWTEFLVWQEWNPVCNLFYPWIPNYQWKFSLDHIFHTSTTTGTGEMEWSAENRPDTDRMDSQTHEDT